MGEVLTEVGLSEQGRDRFRTYSLGMKLRLATAATLLKDPDLLIFDEPTSARCSRSRTRSRPSAAVV